MTAYDYVIVGAGSAGCVLAARLTEDPAVTVALIEAGGNDTAQEIHVPAAYGRLIQSKYDWNLLSEPEPALLGRRLPLARGMMLARASQHDAVQNQRQLCRFDGHCTIRLLPGGRKCKPTSLQSLSPQRVSVPIPVQNLDVIRAPVEEDKQVSAQR